MEEIWKDSSLPYIKVSNLGNLIKLDRSVPTISKLGKEHTLFIKGGVIKPYDNGIGYFQVKTTLSGTVHRKYLHILVWEAFKGSIPTGYEIDHIDCDKKNNNLANLHIVTRKENMIKCHKQNPHIINNLLNVGINKRVY